MIVCLFNWTYFMILKVNKWPPGGAGIVLRLKTRNFRYFLVNFDDFFAEFSMIFGNFMRSPWHRSSMFGRSPVCQFCKNETS